MIYEVPHRYGKNGVCVWCKRSSSFVAEHRQFAFCDQPPIEEAQRAYRRESADDAVRDIVRKGQK